MKSFFLDQSGHYEKELHEQLVLLWSSSSSLVNVHIPPPISVVSFEFPMYVYYKYMAT